MKSKPPTVRDLIVNEDEAQRWERRVKEKYSGSAGLFNLTLIESITYD